MLRFFTIIMILLWISLVITLDCFSLSTVECVYFVKRAMFIFIYDICLLALCSLIYRLKIRGCLFDVCYESEIAYDNLIVL